MIPQSCIICDTALIELEETNMALVRELARVTEERDALSAERKKNKENLLFWSDRAFDKSLLYSEVKSKLDRVLSIVGERESIFGDELKKIKELLK